MVNVIRDKVTGEVVRIVNPEIENLNTVLNELAFYGHDLFSLEIVTADPESLATQPMQVADPDAATFKMDVIEKPIPDHNGET